MTDEIDQVHAFMGAADRVLDRVREEIGRAIAKHPPINSGHEGYAVILEELDELWDEVKADQPRRAIQEAVQVAATAIRFIVDLEAKL